MGLITEAPENGTVRVAVERNVPVDIMHRFEHPIFLQCSNSNGVCVKSRDV